MLAAMNPHMFGHATRWLVFAAVAIAMSYVLRLLASRAEKAGAARVTRAVAALEPKLSVSPFRDRAATDQNTTDESESKKD